MENKYSARSIFNDRNEKILNEYDKMTLRRMRPCDITEHLMKKYGIESPNSVYRILRKENKKKEPATKKSARK